MELPGGIRRRRVFVSARTGSGLEVLRSVIAETAASRLNERAAPPTDVRFDGGASAAAQPDENDFQSALKDAYSSDFDYPTPKATPNATLA